jgi:ABC-type Fe3+-hydroxamate transport system substrate-binding protein
MSASVLSSEGFRYVTDMAGRKVRIPLTVQRVLTAGGTPAVDAFIMAIGKGYTIKNGLPPTMHGRKWKYHLLFDPSLSSQPVVAMSSSSIWTPNMEAIAAIPHDLIFVDNESTARILEKKGFTAISLTGETLNVSGKPWPLWVKFLISRRGPGSLKNIFRTYWRESPLRHRAYRLTGGLVLFISG